MPLGTALDLAAPPAGHPGPARGGRNQRLTATLKKGMIPRLLTLNLMIIPKTTTSAAGADATGAGAGAWLGCGAGVAR